MKKYQTPTTDILRIEAHGLMDYSVTTGEGSGRQHGGAKEWFAFEKDDTEKKKNSVDLEEEEEVTTIPTLHFNVWED